MKRPTSSQSGLFSVRALAERLPGSPWDWAAWSALPAAGLAWLNEAPVPAVLLAISGSIALLAKARREKEPAPAYARIRRQAPQRRR